MKRLRSLFLFALVAIGGFGAYDWWGPGPLARPAMVTIQQGTSLNAASEQLAYAGAVRGLGKRWYYLARLIGSHDAIQAGEYRIPAHASGAAVLDLLQHGNPVQRLMTIPEGMPSVMVQERLAALPFATGEAPLPAEGSVLPDSYSYERGETRAAILKRTTDAMHRTLDALWAKSKGDCPVATPLAALTLASIVEKETGKPAERATVAGAYCNRLKIGMKLDADPTVIYPITKGKPLGRRILRSELDADNGYNTYRRAGLPLGPIANPGKASIAAVLNPAPTKALYFVADGTGGHVFADTLAEHNVNVAKWFAIRRQRGELK
ncbi:endolytic transglycosylase MltG [Sphingomonas sp.]|uniref:endolytic transglycosylase MltG n=1 Tax=Sphingomonas sp. TaxID=28214 RepID=UPI00286D6919|nr:endolytic transglycosylase MltG [Sphingomonas sp.]